MLHARVSVDLSRRVGRIDPNIYGHFIEHLGRCINGGIWGEMLQARKFAGFDEDHDGLPDPWRVIGGRNPHLLAGIEHEGGTRFLRLCCLADTFTHGVAHCALALRRGTRYSLQLELRSVAGDLREVELALGGAREVRPAPGGEWELWKIELPAHWDADDAALTIACRGKGELQVRDVSLMAAHDRELGGFRADVIDLVRAIRPPVVRWPGGCFADGYRWADGVGRRALRKPVFDPAWGAWEPDDFGTDEFVAWCRLVGAEPYICVNTGSADAAQAAAWVQYCNGGADSKLGEYRARNGHPEPHRVRYWGIGNETYGGWEIGNVPAEHYAHTFVEFAQAMRAVDPEIRLIAVGADPVDYPDWNRTVLQIASAQIDYLSVHRYVPHQRDDAQYDRQYHAIVAAPVDIERRLQMVADTIREVLGPGSGVRIAFDEWNVWLNAGRAELLEEHYELRDALFAAGVLNALQRRCADVTMANLAQLVNVLPAIATSHTGAWGTPLYHVFRLFTAQCEPIAVPCTCECESFDAPAFGNVPALCGVGWIDASASVSEDGSRAAVTVVNRHRTEAVDVEVALSGAGEPASAQIALLCGESERAAGSEHAPDAVCIHRQPLPVAGRSLVCLLAPHSAGVVTFTLRPNSDSGPEV
ncbi:MAG: alpha-L-arabinofuranosidase C-terminal domain-containing protein [Armatimonadota bacterium]